MKNQYNWFPAMSGDGQFAKPGASPFNTPMPNTALPGNIFAAQAPKSEGAELVTPESQPNREFLASSTRSQQGSSPNTDATAFSVNSAFTVTGTCSAWRRLVASIIDAVLMSVLAMLPMTALVVALTMGSAGLFDLQLLTDPVVGIGLQIALSLFMLVAYVSCEVFFLARFQATPGKMLMKLKVLGDESAYMSVKDALIRTLVKHMSFLVAGIVPVLGPLALGVLSLLHYNKGGRMFWDAVARKQVYYGI